MLIAALPADAAIWRSDPELRGWTVTDHLLASLIEVEDALSLRALKAQGAKRVPQPIRWPRPGTQAAKPRQPTRDAVAALGGAVISVPEGVSDGG